MLHYHSIAELVRAATERGLSVSRVVLEDQAAALEQPEDAILARMDASLTVMEASAENGAQPDIRSTSGMTGGDGHRLKLHAESGASLSSGFVAKALAKAVAVNEYNAYMGKIVAAPTAGSCGILPAVVLTMMEERGASRQAAVLGLITAGALGLVIANESSISGAEGGCQAECGSAAAMAAGTLVEMAGGTPEMIAHACAIALKNQLGLVCDPVAGLVEVPCVKRNAGGVAIAIAAADMALAGVRSVIPADEVITAMREVGEAMPAALRETAQGGLAATPTGLAIRERIFGTR
jgi:L-serine dehydratase